MMEDNPFSLINIMKGDRGKLFKGHAFSLVQTVLNDEQLLTLSQNYFSSQLVTTTYNCNTRKTNIVYTYYPFINRIPNWYAAFNRELFNLGLPITVSCKLDPFTKLYLSRHHVTLSKTIDTEGLCFKTHKENIDEFANLRNNWKMLREDIKNIDYDLIKDCPILNGDLIITHKLRNTVY